MRKRACGFCLSKYEEKWKNISISAALTMSKKIIEENSLIEALFCCSFYPALTDCKNPH